MRVFHDGVKKLVIENLDGDDCISFLGQVISDFDNVDGIVLGLYQYVESKNHGKILIEQRFIVKSDFFDENYTDKTVELGSKVVGSETNFVLWAPTAVDVKLEIGGNLLPMSRDVKGFYTITLDRNCAGESYLYHLDINGEKVTSCDPYAKATLPNRKASVVVDIEFEKVPLNNLGDVILEMHVRDFSMDPEVPFKHRGQFLGLLESHGDYGFKHILDLGVDVVQLQPVTDFETVDELNPFDAYNWGYDPMQFFALEGSYSSNVHDPIQVLKDFSRVVNEFHNNGLAVTMDVVFNHIYEVNGSSLDACVPYYYFRYVDGKLSDGTFCGNEIASEFTMVRKFIVDACVYFVEMFDIDGYRFDLMGITDLETMNEIRDRLVSIKPNILLYGEGWNMACGLDESNRATMQNADKLPGYAFFNDHFRNTITSTIGGVILDKVLLDDVMEGSPSIFSSHSQTINYVECHDNYTMADQLALIGSGVEGAYSPIKAVMEAKGYAFLQIGQSFFRDKKLVENSYKSDDGVNRINWSYLDRYKELNEETKKLIKSR